MQSCWPRGTNLLGWGNNLVALGEQINIYRLIIKNMAIKFDYYHIPPTFGEEKDSKRYYARVVGGQTVDVEAMAPQIQTSSALSKGDVIHAVEALATEIQHQLSEGNHVYLPGIGYFSLSLSAPKDADPEKTHSQQIKIKKVEFRADQRLKDALNEKASFKRSEVKHHSNKLSDVEVEHMLREAFIKNPYIYRSDFAEMGGLTRATSQRYLNKLIQEGKIVKKGSQRFPTYHPTPEFMKEE